MNWLTSLPLVWLCLGCVGIALLMAFGARALAHATMDEAHRDRALAISAGIMSPLGAGFAILAALTLANAAQHLSSGESIVSSEAANASRLAWASTTHGVDTDSIQTALGQYLVATRTFEWHGTQATNGVDAPTATALAKLENVVRVQATKPGIGTPTSTELLSSVDAITSDRRSRLAAAATQLPSLYVVILAISGAALVVNAGVLTMYATRRTVWIIGGLTLVIGLSIALILGLNSPWQGPVGVSGHAIDTVIADLQRGYFHA
jgi:hypothetical protein